MVPLLLPILSQDEDGTNRNDTAMWFPIINLSSEWYHLLSVISMADRKGRKVSDLAQNPALLLGCHIPPSSVASEPGHHLQDPPSPSNRLQMPHLLLCRCCLA